jgi:hypothetical protein
MAEVSGVTSSGIPRTVDPKFSITTRDQALDLEKAFDKAFGSIGEEPKPATEPEPKPIETEPVETPPVETPKPEETPPEPTPEKKETPRTEGTPPAAAAPATHPDDEVDEELDKLRLHEDSRPETVTVFKQIRGMLKTERKLAKELRERVEKAETELTTARSTVRPVNDPEVQKELETLRSFRTKHQVFDDSGYQMQYEQPVRTLFDEVVADVKKLAPDQAQAAEWEKQMRAVGPDRLDRNYWNEGVINQCADPINKERLVRKISLLLDAQDKRNDFRQKMATEPEAFEQFRTQQASDYWGTFTSEAEDEAKKIIPTLGDWASPRDIALAKTAQERTAAEAHNKVYKEFEDVFQKALTDAATQGPRGMTRVAVQAVLAEKYKRENETLSTQLKKAQAELRVAQDELNKIAGARSTVNKSSGASAAVKSGSEKPKAKLGQSVEEAFAQHNWTRTS